MATINNLDSADNVTGSDLVSIWSQPNGATRKLSLFNLLKWMTGQQITMQDNKITQYAAPVTGGTVQVDERGFSVWLIITPAATLATLTIKLPLVSGVQDRTEILISTTQVLTALTFNANGATIVGAPSTLAANTSTVLRFDAVMRTWYKV